MLVWNTGDFGKEEQVPQKGRGRCWDIECQAEKSVFFYMQLETFKQFCFFFFWERSDLCLLKWVEVTICKMGVIFILILEINSFGLFVVQMK